MPIDEYGVGYSEFTPEKQRKFRAYVEHHLTLCYHVKNSLYTNKHGEQWLDPYYWYFDMTAGPGRHPDYGKGSPLIFLDVASGMTERLRCRAFFFERNPASLTLLKKNVNGHQGVTVVPGDHRETLPALIEQRNLDERQRLGLLYIDTSGDIPPYDLLTAVSARRGFQRVDFLIHFSAANTKRTKHLPGYSDLITHMTQIDKKDWIISKPSGKHQWSFLLGSNYAGIKDWKRLGFHRIDSREGRVFLNRLNFTRQEHLSQIQPTLDFGDEAAS